MKTFFFYDLETSSLNARHGRVMQFAGIRTNMELEPIGEPHNILIRLTDDVLPDPHAIMVTGITPQSTVADGVSEREFAKLLTEEIFTPETIAIGFNNVRFDDEFVRHTLWRNFFDPYEWAWADGRSRWDMLDVVRMTRALRPDGIQWPVDDDGKPVNKLEKIATANSLTHEKAHDALSDVEVLIDIAKLIRTAQPKLFTFLLTLRDKKEVAKLVNLENPVPFVYASGRYGSTFDFATVGYPIAPGTKPGSVLIYDLRQDPSQFKNTTPSALAAALFANREQRQDPSFVAVPVKELSYNKCPAVAPLGVLDEASQERLQVDLAQVSAHLKTLDTMTDFGARIREAYALREPYPTSTDVEDKLYDGFINDKDKGRMAAVRAASAEDLADFHPDFADDRLTELLFRYKARQFPRSLSDDERTTWEQYRATKLQAQLPSYLDTLQKLAMTEADTYLLEELQLWAESIMPVIESDDEV